MLVTIDMIKLGIIIAIAIILSVISLSGAGFSLFSLGRSSKSK
jgi:hypothetical protein